MKKNALLAFLGVLVVISPFFYSTPALADYCASGFATAAVNGTYTSAGATGYGDYYWYNGSVYLYANAGNYPVISSDEMQTVTYYYQNAAGSNAAAVADFTNPSTDWNIASGASPAGSYSAGDCGGGGGGGGGGGTSTPPVTIASNGSVYVTGWTCTNENASTSDCVATATSTVPYAGVPYTDWIAVASVVMTCLVLISLRFLLYNVQR